MAKNLHQVLQQIEQLQKQAEALRSKEAAGVIERIRTAIGHYGITPEQLFGKTRGVKDTATGRPAVRPPKYRSADGQTWGGIGKRPKWFAEALAAGVLADSLLVPQPGRSVRKSKDARKSASSPRVPSGGVPKYKDPSSSRTWTGRGKRPTWFVESIASGMAAEDLLIKA